MLRTDWDALAADVKAAVEAHTGPVHAARTAPAGKNSAIAALLNTARGPIFLKGLRTDDPRVASQEREAVVSAYVSPLAPQLLWQTEIDGWNLLGFQAAPGRRADYTPGSDDLPKVIDAMRRLATLWCPNLPQLKRAERRWAQHIDNTADLALLGGNTLLHTDYSPDNVLIDGPAARLIDWAWPTLGASFIDPGCLVVRLIFAGHTPPQAETYVAPLPAWTNAPKRGLDVLASALATMWTQIAQADPTPWKQQMARSARSWQVWRTGSDEKAFGGRGGRSLCWRTSLPRPRR
jgi:Phosphotransferase enzyme family